MFPTVRLAMFVHHRDNRTVENVPLTTLAAVARSDPAYRKCEEVVKDYRCTVIFERI